FSPCRVSNASPVKRRSLMESPDAREFRVTLFHQRVSPLAPPLQGDRARPNGKGRLLNRFGRDDDDPQSRLDPSDKRSSFPSRNMPCPPPESKAGGGTTPIGLCRSRGRCGPMTLLKNRPDLLIDASDRGPQVIFVFPHRSQPAINRLLHP